MVIIHIVRVNLSMLLGTISMAKRGLFIFLVCQFLASCASPPPKDPDNLCAIFKENRNWYQAAKDAREKWGVPINVPLAMMYQESSFRHDAAPPMKYFLGFIPIGRISSAYGYAQAKTQTWDDYIKATGNRWASRSNFHDAIDFMGWFIYKTHQINGISKWDARRQYLNYHEGWGGYRRGTYKSKPWLIKVADRVNARSKRYASQYHTCKKELNRSWLWRLFFG